MGREQTEIDALATLRPDALREIAQKAIRPFYDDTLARRVAFAAHQWHIEAVSGLPAHPDYESLARPSARHRFRENAVESYNEASESEAYNALSSLQPAPACSPGARASRQGR